MVPSNDSADSDDPRCAPEAVSALRSVEILRLRKGDRVVVTSTVPLSPDVRDRIRDQCAIRFKGYDVLVLDAGLSLSVVRGAAGRKSDPDE